MATYTVLTWDHEGGDWEPEAQGISLWALRPILRGLYGRGYDRDISILVERDDA
jgi:hypothetical protein